MAENEDTKKTTKAEQSERAVKDPYPAYDERPDKEAFTKEQIAHLKEHGLL